MDLQPTALPIELPEDTYNKHKYLTKQVFLYVSKEFTLTCAMDKQCLLMHLSVEFLFAMKVLKETEVENIICSEYRYKTKIRCRKCRITVNKYDPENSYVSNEGGRASMCYYYSLSVKEIDKLLYCLECNEHIG